jgi:hypothetical protein
LHRKTKTNGPASPKSQTKKLKKMKAKIFIGAKITSQHGEGTITNIITKSTGYVEVTYANGSVRKEMAFNLTGEDGEPLKKKSSSETSGMSRGEKKRHNDAKAIAAFDAQTNLQKIKSAIMWINGKQYGDVHSLTVQWIQELFFNIEIEAKEKGNTFIIDVMNTIRRSYLASEKQAYVIARFADENGIKYESIN